MQSFATVAEKHSFSAAANHLNIAVSAISRHVSDLEQHLGCKLLERTTRSMQLTEEGRFFLKEFDEILTRLDNLRTIADEKSQRIAGQLNISSPFHSSGLGLSELINAFIDKHPQVEINWQMYNRFVNMVDEGIDLAFRAGNKFDDSSLVTRKYKDLDVVFIASPEYLQKCGTINHPSEIANHRCIVEAGEKGNIRWRYQENGKEKYQIIQSRLQVNQPNMVAEFAVLGKGIAQLPKYMVNQYLISRELVTLLDEFNPVPLRLYLVYPSKRLIKPAVKAFIAHCFED